VARQCPEGGMIIIAGSKDRFGGGFQGMVFFQIHIGWTKRRGGGGGVFAFSFVFNSCEVLWNSSIHILVVQHNRL
jgi:hypothetical protein